MVRKTTLSSVIIQMTGTARVSIFLLLPDCPQGFSWLECRQYASLARALVRRIEQALMVCLSEEESQRLMFHVEDV